MVFKIRTSKRTMQCFEEIAASTNYAPFILSKLAISMSIKSGKPLEERDFHTDSYGLELNRQTITGEWDDLFKSLIEMFEKKHINLLYYRHSDSEDKRPSFPAACFLAGVCDFSYWQTYGCGT